MRPPCQLVHDGPRRNRAGRPPRSAFTVYRVRRGVRAKTIEVFERLRLLAGVWRGRWRVVPAWPGERQRVGLAGRRWPWPSRPLGHGGLRRQRVTWRDVRRARRPPVDCRRDACIPPLCIDALSVLVWAQFFTADRLFGDVRELRDVTLFVTNSMLLFIALLSP